MIISDNIQIAHDIRFGIPMPTADMQRDYARGMQFKERTDTFFLSAFPENVYPSGGLSNKVSESEMIGVQVAMFGDVNDAGRITFTDVSGRTIYASNWQDTQGDATFDYALIGRFSHEIRQAGEITAKIETAFGDAELRFFRDRCCTGRGE